MAKTATSNVKWHRLSPGRYYARSHESKQCWVERTPEGHWRASIMHRDGASYIKDRDVGVYESSKAAKAAGEAELQRQ